MIIISKIELDFHIRVSHCSKLKVHFFYLVMNFSMYFSICLSGLVLTYAYPQRTRTSEPVLAATGGAGGRGRGSAVSTDCSTREVSPGKFAVVCEDLGRSNPEALTLRSEHVLWINQDGTQSQDIDVLVPNYRIDELIKAGFKGSSDGQTRVNILLKRPEQTYNAQVGERGGSQSPPSVSVLYEPVQKVLVHYPNDKPYSPSSGPIIPPA